MRTRRITRTTESSIRYVFRDGAILGFQNAKVADPQKIGEALEGIATANAGRLTPDAIVDAASRSDHALHPFFLWDDAEAAHRYRLDQARLLVRLVRIEDDQLDDPPAWLSVSLGKGGVSYRSVGEVLGSRELQDAVLKAAERDLIAFEARYHRLTDICELVREARERIADRRARTETRDSSRAGV